MNNNELFVVSKTELYAFIQEQFSEFRKDVYQSTTLMAEKANDELLTRKQAVEYLKISYPTLHHWTKKNVIKHVKIQSRVYYLKSDLMKSIR